MDMFSICFISAKSNDIKNIFLKSIFVQKIASTFIYDINMSPEHFEIKKEIFASPVTVKNRQLSIVPLKGEFHPIWNLHRVLPTHRIL